MSEWSLTPSQKAEFSMLVERAAQCSDDRMIIIKSSDEEDKDFWVEGGTLYIHSRVGPLKGPISVGVSEPSEVDSGSVDATIRPIYTTAFETYQVRPTPLEGFTRRKKGGRSRNWWVR